MKAYPIVLPVVIQLQFQFVPTNFSLFKSYIEI